MTSEEFKNEVAAIAQKRSFGEIDALTTGRLYRELCDKYLETHDSLPEGYC